jgi:NAD(P)H dehydrogenase (quinone)
MTRMLVVYSSKTGNTEALAKAVAEGARSVEEVEGVLKKLVDVTNDDLINTDGLIVGSPTYFGCMSGEVKDVFERSIEIRGKLEGKVGGGFSTSAHPTGGKETTMMSILQAMLIHGMIVGGDPIKAGGYYGVAIAGISDHKTLEVAKSLGTT